MCKILIISTSQDPSTNDVVLHLNEIGTPWVRLNLDYLGENLLGSRRIGLGEGSDGVEFLSHRQHVRDEEISVVWNRRSVQPPALRENLSVHEKTFIKREITRFWRGNFEGLAGKYWVNDWKSSKITKPEQLQAALRCGLSIPPTLISNDPSAIRGFIEEHGPEVIVKPVSHGTVGNLYDFSSRPDEGMSKGYPNVCLTQKIGLREAQDDFTLFASPAIYQPFIAKDREIRVTMVGDRLFAAAVHVDEIPGDADNRVDWRRLGSRLLDVPHSTPSLPEDLERRLRAFMSDLNLVFGCIDILVTPAGDYLFLEVNPHGQWGWIEVITGLPITRGVADLLTAHARG